MASAPSSAAASAPHVAVVTFPFTSHPALLFTFARALAAAAPAGTTLSFLSTASSIEQLRKACSSDLSANLRFVEVPDGLAADDADAPLLRRIELFMAAADRGGTKAGIEAARAAAGGVAVTCVVGDAFVLPAAEVGVPWVPFWVASLPALLAFLRTDELRAEYGGGGADKVDELQLMASHPGLARYRVRDFPDGVVSGDQDHFVSRLVHRMSKILPRAAAGAVALSALPGLDPPDVAVALATLFPKAECLPVGSPYHLLPATTTQSDDADDPHGCLAWLERHPAHSAAYVAFGTVASPPPDELRELAAGLESCGAPFLWSLREDSWPLLPAGFLDRAAASGSGLVVPWAPQVAVLRHSAVGAFVMHAGWGSVMEAVSCGMPMACRPFLADNTMNARTVAHVWGVGTAFDGPMTRAAVAEVVGALLHGEEGARMRARAQELQAAMTQAFQPGGACRNNFDKFVEIVCRV